jgi:hypothetical protein
MEAVFSSESLVNFLKATRCHIPEDSILHSHKKIRDLFQQFTQAEESDIYYGVISPRGIVWVRHKDS